MTIETLHAMPKTEVHLHLEGTVAPETLWDMASRNGVALPAGSLEELRTRYAFESFEPFLELWMAMSRCFRTEADYAQMVDDYVAECTRQNIRYVEAHFTPYNHERFGFGGERALALVTERLLHHESRGGPVTRLILDIPAESVPESGAFTIDLLERLDNPLVVAIGLGGPEVGFPRIAVEPYFERARRAGYPCVAHAGETEGAHHVHEAVHRLRARRVQHGVRAVEDPAVLALLAERDICCDVTLTSNLFLTRYTELRHHPLLQLMEAGVPVTLSTDDSPFFGTDLLREYRLAHEELGLSVSDLWQINLNGLRYGLAETGLRRRLLLEFLEAGRQLGLESRPD